MPNQLYQDNPATSNDPTVLVGAGQSPPPSTYRNIGQIGTEGNMNDVYTLTPPAQTQENTLPNIPPGIDPGFWNSAIKTIGYNPFTINPVQDAMQEWSINEAKAFNQVFSGTGITESSMTPEALKYWNDIKTNTMKQLTEQYQSKQATGKAYLDMMEKEWEKKVSPAMQQFESVTGINPQTRGTPEYSKAFMTFMQQQNAAKAMGTQEAQKGLISPESMESAYQFLKTSGTLPPEIGRLFRLPIAQTELINYVAKRQTEEGLTGVDRAVNAALYKAGETELVNVAKLHGIASVAMGAAQQHAETIIGLADKKNDTGIPALDRWFRAGKKAIAGDTDVTNLDLAIHVFDREFARYLSSMTASGQMAQEEANNVQKLIAGAMTPQQIKGALKTAENLMQGKNKSFIDTRNRIRNELLSGGKSLDEVNALFNGKVQQETTNTIKTQTLKVGDTFQGKIIKQVLKGGKTGKPIYEFSDGSHVYAQ